MIGRFLTSIFGQATDNRDPLADFWYEAIEIVANETYAPSEAKQLPVVQDSLKALADPVGTLPLHVYEREADGSRRRVDNHPISALLSRRANARNTAYEFRAFMQQDLGWEKNALAEIVQDPATGLIAELRPIRWTRVIEVLPNDDGGVLYRFRARDGRIRTLRNDEVMHLRAAPFDEDCVCGVPIWKTGRAALGLALAIHRYGRLFFENSGHSGGVIEFPNEFKTPEDRRKFLERWRAASAGKNAHKDRVLEFGGKYTPTVVKNNEAQFREAKMDANRAVGRLWRMPPHKIGDLERAHFDNIESQSIEFVQEVLMPELIIWEQAIHRDLLFDEPGFFAEFDVAGLLRGDLKSRYEAYSLAIQWWATENEIRRKENLDPIDGGDVRRRPLNMGPNEDGAADGQSQARDVRAMVLDILAESEAKNANVQPLAPTIREPVTVNLHIPEMRMSDVYVEAPHGGRERVKVIKHDKDGRILEFEKTRERA